MKRFRNSLVVLASCTVSSVHGFGPQLEPLSKKYRSASQTLRFYTSESEAHRSHDQTKSPRLQSCEFEFISAAFDNLDDFSLLFDQDVFDGTFPMLMERADALTLETFEENELLEFDAWDDCGEDCIECEIPKDWLLPGEPIDVMEFLGVTRVKPLS